MEKKESNYYLHRVYKLLASNDEVFYLRLKKLRDKGEEEVHGELLPHNNHIHVDPRKAVLATTLHEALHHMYQHWSETTVELIERGMCHNMTSRQFGNLTVRLGDYLVRMGLANRRKNV